MKVHQYFGFIDEYLLLCFLIDLNAKIFVTLIVELKSIFQCSHFLCLHFLACIHYRRSIKIISAT